MSAKDELWAGIVAEVQRAVFLDSPQGTLAVTNAILALVGPEAVKVVEPKAHSESYWTQGYETACRNHAAALRELFGMEQSE